MTDDLIEQLRCYPANRLCRQVADALEEITASREAVWKHAKMLEKDLLAHKERIAELEAYVERIAKQKLTDEMGEHIKEIADYEGAYNYMVKDARDYLRAARTAYLGEKE